MKNNNKSNLKKMIAIGSKTAKGGFRNEKDVIKHFNNWENDELAQKWLKVMGYDISNIEYVKAIKVKGHFKADVQVCVRIIIKLKMQEDLQNLSIKLVSNPHGFNQIDKRRVDKYVKLWSIPDEVTKILKLFTGEIKPIKKNIKDSRRMFLTEMSKEDLGKVINFFESKKILVISDVLKGRGEFSADWMLVILKINEGKQWVLKSINEVLQVFGNGNVRLTEKGSLWIGRIKMQRKGGDGGRETAKMLQFKINPVELFKD